MCLHSRNRATRFLPAAFLAQAWLLGGPALAEPACDDAGSATRQIECSLAAAEDAGDPGICRQATELAIRFNCISLYAERRGDPVACRELAAETQDGQVLRDACVSGVAAATGEAAICALAEIAALRDACYLSLVLDHGGDPAVCSEIEMPALQTACRDGG